MNIFKKFGAKAIWKDHEKKINRYVKFQTAFTLQANTSDEPVLFHVCTDTDFELYINGALAAFGQYEDYPDKKIYTGYDISAHVKEGTNLVSILAFSLGEDTQIHLTGLPMIIFAATCGETCLLKSDEQTFCAEAEEMRSGKCEVITFELQYNFDINLRKDDGYRSAMVCEGWDNAVICDDSGITYMPRPIKPLTLEEEICQGQIVTQGIYEMGTGDTIAAQMQYAALSFREAEYCFEGGAYNPANAESTTQTSPCSKEPLHTLSLKEPNCFWIIDLGAESVGYIAVDVEADSGAELCIAYGEHLADMRVRSRVGIRNYAFRITCKEGRQKIRFYMRRMACRYLQIFAGNGIHTIYELGLHKTHYPIDFFSPLKINDRLFNKIYQISQNTLELCMHMHYEDCPGREQSLYGMDSRNQMLAGYYAFGETAMPRASLTLLAQGQWENGLLEICAPATYERTIPYFSLAWLCAVQEYILYSGDTAFAKEMLPYAKKLIDFFVPDKETGLLERPASPECWNFYEWTHGMDTGNGADHIIYDAPLNAFYVMTLRKYLDICKWSNDLSEEAKATKLIGTIAAAFHDAFYCPEKKAYKSFLDQGKPHFAQLTQAWALCAGCVPKEWQSVIRASMLTGNMVEISLSHSIFLYEALMQDSASYAETVLDDIERKWGYMLYQGATSFWETIDGEKAFMRAGSLCHGWSATPAYIFWRYIMGIYPTKPGFQEYAVKPCCPKYLQAEGILKIPRGTLQANLYEGATTVKLCTPE